MYSILRAAVRNARSAHRERKDVQFCDGCVQVTDERSRDTAHRDRMAAIAIQVRY